MNKKLYSKTLLIGFATIAMTACSDDSNYTATNENVNVGKETGNFTAAEWYSGGDKRYYRE